MERLNKGSKIIFGKLIKKIKTAELVQYTN